MPKVEMEDGVVVSQEPSHLPEIPDMSVPNFMLKNLAKNLREWKDRPWMVSISSGTTITFGELEGLSLKVASALSRRGFQQNQVLYYVTYDMAYLYVLKFAVWRLGGAVRGCYQQEYPEEYARQIRETQSQFILMDPETAPTLKKAIATLDYDVTMLSIGEVEGATSMHLLMQDDGSEFPESVVINPRESILVIVNTSGSTGKPKGVVHTHHTILAAIYSTDVFVPGPSLLTLLMNYAMINVMLTINSLYRGTTVYHLGKFQRETYCSHLIKYKPSSAMMYPFIVTWLARCPELDELDLSFLKNIMFAGSAIDPTTTSLLSSRLPNAWIMQMYGMSELQMVSATYVGVKDGAKNSPVVIENHGEQCVTSGKLAYGVVAKVVDQVTRKTLGRGERGEILLKSPCIMHSYFKLGMNNTDEGGWYHTGDLGFIDDDDNIYIKERLSFMFRHSGHFVSPSQIEGILQEHPAVQIAGVVGVPNPDTVSDARAYVVLRPGHVTEGEEEERMASELVQWVGARLPHYKHLYGGVRFLPSLPVNRGGKLDRLKLRDFAFSDQS